MLTSAAQVLKRYNAVTCKQQQKNQSLLREASEEEEKLCSLRKVVFTVKKSSVFTIITQKEKEFKNILQLYTLNLTLQISLIVIVSFTLIQ